MAVTLNKKSVAPETEVVKTVSGGNPLPPATQQEVGVVLELAVHERLVVGKQLYEKNVAYTFSPEVADQMLLLSTPAGLPSFKRYKPRVKVQRNRDGVESQDMRTSDLPPRLMQPKPTLEELHPAERAAPKRIDVGDDAELEAEGINLDGPTEEDPTEIQI